MFGTIRFWLRVGRNKAIVLVGNAGVSLQQVPPRKGRPAETCIWLLLGIWTRPVSTIDVIHIATQQLEELTDDHPSYCNSNQTTYECEHGARGVLFSENSGRNGRRRGIWLQHSSDDCLGGWETIGTTLRRHWGGESGWTSRDKRNEWGNKYGQ